MFLKADNLMGLCSDFETESTRVRRSRQLHQIMGLYSNFETESTWVRRSRQLPQNIKLTREFSESKVKVVVTPVYYGSRLLSSG